MVDQTYALVTGANRGLGREVAVQLADAGMTVYAATRCGVSASPPVSTFPFPLDITVSTQVDRAADWTAAELGHLDVLIANAAVRGAMSETASEADLLAAQTVFDVNLFGTWRVVQAFTPLLRRSEHPRIVVVSSGAGSHEDHPFGLADRGGHAPSYGISKAALNALVSALAAEWADSHLVINAVCPGLTATSPGAEQRGARPAEHSARGVVWAATLPDDGPRGGLFRDGERLPW